MNIKTVFGTALRAVLIGAPCVYMITHSNDLPTGSLSHEQVVWGLRLVPCAIGLVVGLLDGLRRVYEFTTIVSAWISLLVGAMMLSMTVTLAIDTDWARQIILYTMIGCGLGLIIGNRVGTKIDKKLHVADLMYRPRYGVARE